MPREPRRRTGSAQRSKEGAARQTTLFSFLKQTSLKKDEIEVPNSASSECAIADDAPPSSSSPTASGDWIILDTPPSLRPVAASSSSKRLTGRPALGTLVVPGIDNVPGILPAPVKLTPRQHKAPRRSSFLLRRHELAREKRLAEALRTGRLVAPESRNGNYDGLNYAPIEQNASSTGAIQIAASQRARKMALAAAMTASSRGPAKRCCVNQATSSQTINDTVADGEATSQMERSFVFEDDCPPTSRRTSLPLLLPTAKLDTQELDALNGLLNEDPTRRVLKSPRAHPHSHKSSLRPVTLLSTPADSQKLSLDKENIDLLGELDHSPAVCTQSKNTQKDSPRSPNSPSPQTSLTRDGKRENEAENISPSRPQEGSYTSDNSLVGAALSDWSYTSSDGLGVATETFLPSDLPTDNRNWFRCQVRAVVPTNRALKISLDICGVPAGVKLGIEADLSGTWADTPVKVGDIANLVPSCSPSIPALSCQRLWHLSDSDTTQSEESQPPPLFVLHPDLLLSGTTVVSSLTCMRRSVLQQFWASGGDCVQIPETASRSDASGSPPSSAAGQLMLIGTVVHEVFQKLVCSEDPVDETSALSAFFKSVLKQAIILQVYALGLDVLDFCLELCDFIPHILKWIAENPRRNKAPASHTIRRSSRQVTPTLLDVLDVEENLWIPKLGVKGKIDMTVSCSPAGLNSSKESTDRPLMIPFELKTGRPSYSFEHIGQVLLYTLMLADRYADRLNTSDGMDVGTCGWLAYLREPASDRHANPQNRAIIRPSAPSFRGLIQTRNRLADAVQQVISLEKLRSSAWRPSLPSHIGQMRICSSCPQQLTCGLFLNKPTIGNAESEVEQLLRSRCSHLSASHVEFFCHWSRLQLLEHATASRLDSVVAEIVGSNLSSTESAPPGCIRGLVLEQTSRSTEPGSDDYLIRLRKNDGNPIQLKACSVGDFVIVSSDDGRHVGLCLATISDYHDCETDPTATTAAPTPVDSNPSPTISIRCDRQLPTWIQAFRIDRYISDKATQINLSNLVELMQDTPLSSRLRELLIDRRPPVFTGSLPKSVILKIRSFLKPLNPCQRTAVLSVLMSKDYTLIEGFPGSGKTETMASLIRCLACLHKKTLLVSFTHSAVDNVLARLTEGPHINIVRLGATERVAAAVRPLSFEQSLTSHVRHLTDQPGSQLAQSLQSAVDFVRQAVESADVVACTALAAGGSTLSHSALSHITFDVVLVDEATQLLMPTVLGGLLRLQPDGQFVLVGDTKQLPPLVQSSEARLAGFSKSLFSCLLSSTLRDLETQLPFDAVSGSKEPSGGCLQELTLQYRMNSRILRLTNGLFYEDKMKCASEAVARATLPFSADFVTAFLGEEGKRKDSLWIKRALSPELEDSVIFLNTENLRDCRLAPPATGRTKANDMETIIIYALLEKLLLLGVDASDIGLVAPYRAQVAALRRVVNDLPNVEKLEVNTVDQYQGRDKSVIIVSFVDCINPLLSSATPTSCEPSNGPVKLLSSARANTSLLDDMSRLTVALTRAKHKLIMIGCAGHPAAAAKAPCTDGTLCRLSRILHAQRAVELIPGDWKF
ncbi:hypothetical protein AAHC03_0874 [Spirometra sp. Aus1]